MSKSAEEILHKAALQDEPVFVIRAKDFFAVQVINFYLELIEKFGPSNLSFQESVWEVLNDIREWQSNNMDQVRYPD